MKTKKEWVILGRFRKDEKFHTVDGGVLGTKFKTIEEVRARLKVLKAENEAEMKAQKCRGQSFGLIAIETQYHSDYDIVEWKIREREVTPWYDVE